MDDEKLTALKKAYADIILDTAKEAAARVMASEKKSVRLQREIDYAKAEAVRMLLRLKQTYDSKVGEVEMKTLSQQGKIDELEAQLQEAEEIVSDLRGELSEVHDQLERVRKRRALDRQSLEAGTTDPGKVSPDVQCSQKMITSKANLQEKVVVTDDEKCNSNGEYEGSKCDIAPDRQNLEVGTSDPGKVLPDVQCFQGMITSKANLQAEGVVTNDEKCNSNYEGSKCDIATDRHNLELGTSDPGKVSPDVQCFQGMITSKANLQAEGVVANDEKCKSNGAYEGSKCDITPDRQNVEVSTSDPGDLSQDIQRVPDMIPYEVNVQAEAAVTNDEKCSSDGAYEGSECHTAPDSLKDDNYVHNRDFASVMLRSKESELYRNGCTQRIRAFERNEKFPRSEQVDDAKQAKLIEENGDDKGISVTSTPKCDDINKVEKNVVGKKRLPDESNREKEELEAEKRWQRRKRRATKLPLLYMNSSCCTTSPSKVDNNGFTGDSIQIPEDITLEVAASLSNLKSKPSDTSEMSSRPASDMVAESDVQLIRPWGVQKETINDLEKADLTSNECLAVKSLELLAGRTDVENERIAYERKRKRKKELETVEVPRKERKMRATKLPLLYIEMSQVSGSSCSSTTPSSSNNKGLTDNIAKVSEDKTPEVMASLSTPKAPSYTTEMSSQSASDMVTKSDVQLNRIGSVQKETNDTTCTQQTDSTRNKCLSAESSEVLACKTDVEKGHSDLNPSNPDDLVASQPVSNKFLKYTFHRKHKNETLSTSERNSQNGSVEGNTRETKTGYQQPSLMTASSRDNRRLALVAHQLISLSEKKHHL